VIYDLGSGDGRVVIAALRDFGARQALGIEVNPQLVQESRDKAPKLVWQTASSSSKRSVYE